MMDSQPASCPAQTCSDPTDVNISVRISVTTTLPDIRHST